jgi:phage shock protein PspC (stress-responsive transcriptional regulator)
MKKTVSINISGIIFHIDDDAFERLSRYLNSIKRHFANMEGKDEIITDIESRIAEVLQEKLQDNKQVISIEDIQEVITLMGEPSEMDEDSEYEEARTYQTYTYNRGKRLYRDPDGRMIAGVSSGLAAYFNIDPVWVRILFIVSLFAGFFGLIAYIVLWIVIPEAITTAEKLEMRGEPVNISNIERSVRDEFDNVKGKFNEFAGEARETFKKKSTGSSRFFDRLIDFIGTVLRVFFKIIAILLGIVFILAGLGFILTFTAGFAGLSSFSFFENGELVNFQLMQFMDMIFTSPLLGTMAIVGAVLMFGIPLIMLIYLGFRLLLGKRVKIPYFSITALALWLLGLILAIIVGVNTGMDFRHSAGEISPPIEIQMSEKQILYFDVQDDKHLDNRTGTFEVFDGEYSARIDDNGISIFEIPYVEFRKSVTDVASVNITAYAKGSSRDKARQRARALEYHISHSDTSFSLSTYYYFPHDAVIRAQEVQLDIEIPEGQIVHFNRNMKDFFDENPNWRVHNKGYEGKTWIMTRNGLKPYVEGMEIEKPEEVEDTGSVNEIPRYLSLIPVTLIGV